MCAMPAGREWMRGFVGKIDNVDSAFPETQCGFDGFNQASAIWSADFDAVLDDLNAGAETQFLRIDIDAHDFVIDPNSQIALRLEELEKLFRFRFRRNGNPK